MSNQIVPKNAGKFHPHSANGKRFPWMYMYGRAAVFTGIALLGPSLAQAQITLEGCLTPGSRPGEFTLTEDATGALITVTGKGSLADHTANHRERLTGQYDGERNVVFLVKESEHLADSCRPLYERVSERVEELIGDLRRNAALGFRIGIAADPEMLLLGAHAELSTGIDRFVFRPNIEFGFGEVTAEYAFNVEGVYKIPFTRNSRGRLEVWHIYVGGGPSVSVFNQEFRERDFNETSSTPADEMFTFDDADTEVGFNVLVGFERQNGFFGEMKAGAYGNPSIRLLLGFTF